MLKMLWSFQQETIFSYVANRGKVDLDEQREDSV